MKSIWTYFHLTPKHKAFSRIEHIAPTGASPWNPDEFSSRVMGLLQKFPVAPAYGHTEMVALVEAPDNCCLCQTSYRVPQSPWTLDYSNAWGPIVVQTVHAVLPVRGLLGHLCSGHPSTLPRILLQHSWGLEKTVNTASYLPTQEACPMSAFHPCLATEVVSSKANDVM